MFSAPSSRFEKAAAEFQRDDSGVVRLRDALDRQNRLREDTRARFRDWKTVRAAAAAIRDGDIRHMEKRLGDFAVRFERAGGILHWAPAATDAAEILATIAKEAGAKTAVLTHSTTLAEIGAQAALTGARVKTTETYFGDLATGFAKERPAHLLAPAMQMSHPAVGAALHKGTGEPTTVSPEEQVAIVRRTLRETFLSADMAVTGASFLLADEGKAVLLDSEGNLRLAAALPRLLVIVAGIDKVTGSSADLPLLLQSVAASATNRLVTPGVSILGPAAERACGEKTAMHIILVDNNRTALLADPARAETLRCVKCGACADVCPVFRMAGGAAYRNPLPGPLGAVLAPHLMAGKKTDALALATPLCGACDEVCPVGIDLHRALVSQRRETPPGALGWRLRMFLRIFVLAMSSPGNYKIAARIARLFVRTADITRGTPFNPLAEWARDRSLPTPPEKSFRKWWKQDGRTRDGKGSDR